MKYRLRWLTALAFVTLLLSCGGGELVRPDSVDDEPRARVQSVEACLVPTTVSVGSIDLEGDPSESSGGDATTGSNNSGTRPDLVIIELSLEDASHNPISTLHINTSARCRMRIKNQGNASAGAFRTSCYISDGLKTDNNPQDMGGETTQSLSAGSTQTEHEDFTLEYPGWYNMMACADSAHDVAESNENNQCMREVAFEVVSSPNLTLTAIATTTGKTVFDPGEAFSVNVTAANTGENFGKSIYVGWYMTGGSYGTNEVFLTSDRIKRENLKGGMTKVENLDTAYAPTVPGSYTLIARIDYNGRVAETDESDNEIRLNFTVKGSSPEDDDDLFQLLLN